MRVDSHVHVFFEGSDPEEFIMGCARVGAGIVEQKSGVAVDPEVLRTSAMGELGDPDASKLVGWMDEAGIDRAVLLPLDFGMGCDEPAQKPLERLTILEKNELYAEFTRRFPGRLVSYLGVDPRRKGGLELFRRGIEEWGMLGLKLHPTAGFYPQDPVCYPFYEAAREMGVPVLIHSGTEPAPLKPMFSQPKYIDAVAADFPEVTFIIAHCGHGWWMEALDMALSKPNQYVDFSGWQAEYNGDPDYFYFALRAAINVLSPWRVMFGTDGSMTNVMLWPKDWMEAWLEPKSPSGITFSSEEIDIVTGGAAAKLYGWE
jgi:predicted TIM-barrel fold metal-dependent hydrolase